MIIKNNYFIILNHLKPTIENLIFLNEDYCVVMESWDGDLRQIFNKYKPKGWPIVMINKIFIKLNDALKTMKDLNYIHRFKTRKYFN